MEIRNLTYNAAIRAYQALVCFPRHGRMMMVPASVNSEKAVRPALLTEILTHRAKRQFID